MPLTTVRIHAITPLSRFTCPELTPGTPRLPPETASNRPLVFEPLGKQLSLTSLSLLPFALQDESYSKRSSLELAGTSWPAEKKRLETVLEELKQESDALLKRIGERAQ
jgi:hypothetical protein